MFSVKNAFMRILKPMLIACSVGLCLTLISAVGAYADFGPLQTTNRFPLHLLFLKPRPVKAELPARGAFEAGLAVEYSNTFFQHRNNRWDVLVDAEMMTIDLSMIYGLTSNIAILLDMPLVSQQDGFLDGFLENYHDALGTSNYGRQNRPKNAFAYRVVKDGRLWVQGEETNCQLADMTVSTQFQLFRPSAERRSSGSLLLSLKLPTGDSDRGLGSGQFDTGAYLPLRWSLSPWTLFAMPGAAMISDPDTRGAQIRARNTWSLFFGTAYDYSRDTTWLIQCNYYSSPIEETGLDELDKGAFELIFGAHHRLADNWLVEFAFSEDLTLAVPDFNLRLGLRRTWRSGR
jgi:hypothetical protein